MAIIAAGEDRSPEAIQVTSAQALEGLACLKEAVHSRRPEDAPRPEEIYLR